MRTPSAITTMPYGRMPRPIDHRRVPVGTPNGHVRLVNDELLLVSSRGDLDDPTRADHVDRFGKGRRVGGNGNRRAGGGVEGAAAGKRMTVCTDGCDEEGTEHALSVDIHCRTSVGERLICRRT